ncbi:MAG: amidohydrolase family protein [Zymomonas mobilis]|uniref:Amidohydrolase 3 domain-containing protein n=1 Tax=Zymomonas mobilis TaxID=542 RepID=A0A542W218_ZYMMB|nr:amidohydrolase family protein [Zymomonas mobilis]TQL17634.1 hypothetical protein FBY58_1232 [Zymomonas mobilis]
MKIVKTLAFIAGLTAFTALPAYADGLIDQVNGITFDNKGHPYRFNALLIGRDGKVTKLLNKNDKRPASPDFYLNGQNKTLIPGFVDAHSHIMASGEDALQLDLSDTHSLAEAQEKLKQFASDHPTARWILGSGWNEQRWHSATMPQASDIDKIVNDRPVWLLRSDGYIGLANSLALEKAQIKPAQNPDKTASIGIITGEAIDRLKQAIPPLQPIERDAAFLTIQKILLSRGITSATDMGTSVDDWNVMRRMGDLGRLRLRIKSYAQGIEPLLSIAGKYPTSLLYDGHLSMSGVTFTIDGNIVSRHAWLKQAYSDNSSQQGSDTLNDTKLRNLMSRAAMDGFQVAVQASGDAASNQLLNAIDELSQSYKGDRRWRIENASLIDNGDLKRLSQYDLVVSMQPASYFTDKAVIEQRIGANRLPEIEAWDDLLDHSVQVTFGGISASPFETIADILDRQDSLDKKDKKLNRENVFSYYMIQPAYAAFAEKQIGRLMPGYYADFLFLDRDPLTVDNNALRQTKILESWVGGRQAWSHN